MRILKIVLLIAVTIYTSVSTADVYLNKQSNPQLVIHGMIKKGDYQEAQNIVKEIYTSYNKEEKNYRILDLSVFLDTLGGDIEEAMMIGKMVRGLKLYTSTGLGEGDCASACVLIFIAGAERGGGGNMIGIHRPYFGKEYFSGLSPDEAKLKYDALTLSVEEYLIDMGASKEFLEVMFRVPSSEIKYLSFDEYYKWLDDPPIAYQEWLTSRCGAYTKAELNDYIYMGLMPDSGMETRIKIGQEGYANYLKEKIPKTHRCRDRATFEARFKYLKKIFPVKNQELWTIIEAANRLDFPRTEGHSYTLN